MQWLPKIHTSSSVSGEKSNSFLWVASPSKMVNSNFLFTWSHCFSLNQSLEMLWPHAPRSMPPWPFNISAKGTVVLYLSIPSKKLYFQHTLLQAMKWKEKIICGEKNKVVIKKSWIKEIFSLSLKKPLFQSRTGMIMHVYVTALVNWNFYLIFVLGWKLLQWQDWKMQTHSPKFLIMKPWIYKPWLEGA